MNGDGCDMTCIVEIPYACSHAPTIALGTTAGTTTTGTNAFSAPVDNMNCGDGAGTDGNEVFYTYTPATSGMLTLAVTPTGMADLGLYARTDCTSTASQVGCSDTGLGGDPETLTIPVTASTPVTIFVDAFASIGGPFMLTLTQN